MEKELRTIKRVIFETAKKYGIEVDKVILFGSRARGDYREDSDWDILVVTREKLDNRTKISFWHEVYRKIDFPADIIVVSRETFEKFKGDYGFVYRYALEEGITV